MNGVGEDEVTITSGLHAQAERTNKQTNRQGREGYMYIVTSGLHAQAERTKRQTEERGLQTVEASTKIQRQVMLLTHGGARLATEGVPCRRGKAAWLPIA